MNQKREENTADSPPHADPKGLNPAGLGPAQPQEVEESPRRPEPSKPGGEGDRTKDSKGGGI
jgi:hypothetical protein